MPDDPTNKADGKLRRHVEKLETALETSEAEIQRQQRIADGCLTLLDASKSAALMLEPDGTILVVNDAGARSLGTVEAELVGVNLYGVLPPEVAIERRQRINKLIRKRKPLRFNEEIRGRSYDTQLLPFFDEAGEIELVGLVARNVTEEKWSEDRLAQTMGKLQESLSSTIVAMSRLVETRDPYTAGHQKGVAAISTALAEELGLGSNVVDGIWVAGTIHDVGKVGVPSELLNRPARLSQIELNIIKEHSRIGHDVLMEIEFPWPIAEIVHQHHERWKGQGYPRGLKGEGILLEARVLAVADVLEAMAAHRPYRPAKTSREAMNEVVDNRGNLYDPTVVDACVALFEKEGWTWDEESLTRESRWSIGEWTDSWDDLSTAC